MTLKLEGIKDFEVQIGYHDEGFKHHEEIYFP